MLKYRLRIRTADDTADLLVITTDRAGTNPYLQGAPTGDGASVDPITGQAMAGSWTVNVVDAITSGTSRVVTSQLEDSTFRQQLAGRKGYCDIDTGSGYNVQNAGLVSSVEFVSAIECAISFVEPQQLEHETTAFAAKTALITCSSNAALSATTIAVAALPFQLTQGTTLLFSGFKIATLTADAALGATSLAVSALLQAINATEVAVATEPIAAYMARWPNRGCLFGGPITGGFQASTINIPDLGGWEMICAQSSGSLRWLSFRGGYTAPNFTRTKNAKDVMPHLEGAASKLYNYSNFAGPLNQLRSVDDARRHSLWPSMVIEIIGVGYFMAASLRFFGSTDLGAGQVGHLTNDTVLPGIFLYASGLSVSSTGLRVRGFTVDPSDRSPIYWTGHPIDLAVKLADEAGQAVNATSVTTVRNAIGAQQRLTIRVTAVQNRGDFLDAAVYGPFGIGVRVDSNNALEFFTTRIRNSSGPGVTLTNADVVKGTVEPFLLDADHAIRKVIATQHRIVRAQDSSVVANDFSDALDGIVEQEERIEYPNPDPLAVGTNEATYNVPGMVHLDGAASTWPQYVDGIAREIFDRFGRGPVSAKMTTLRGGAGDGLKLGDEVLINLKQTPNHNKRILDDNTVPARAMQVVRTTPIAAGAALELLDSGANANATGTLPTLSIAASSDYPRTVAELTITNAAALNAAQIGVRIQMQTTTGGADVLTDYAVVDAYQAGAVPTGVIRLPTVPAGRKVFARARSEQTTTRPTAYSTAVSVTLTAINPPTSVTVTPSGSDGSLATVAWTIGSGSSDLLTDVYLRAQGAPFSVAVRQQILKAGSTQYVLEQLTPAALYTASVQHRDPLTNDLSTLVDVNFTAGGTTVTLPTPLYPQGFVGTQRKTAYL